MPYVAYDDDVTGSGVATFTTADVLFVSVDLTDLGLMTRQIDDADHILRAGWWCLGDSFDIGLGTHDYWDAPRYVDLVATRWTPEPTRVGAGTFNTYIANRIRWHFGPGVEAHLHILAL